MAENTDQQKPDKTGEKQWEDSWRPEDKAQEAAEEQEQTGERPPQINRGKESSIGPQQI